MTAQNATTETKEAVEEEVIQIKDEKEDNSEKLAKQVSEFKDMAQRIQAEFDNYRKRNAESVRNARNDGIDEIITALFPILDSYERCLQSITDENIKNGVNLIYKQLTSVLTKFDVAEIAALGQNFDPKYHHAIAQCEDKENADKVVEVFQKGYQRKDKILRPTMVKVAQ